MTGDMTALPAPQPLLGRAFFHLATAVECILSLRAFPWRGGMGAEHAKMPEDNPMSLVDWGYIHSNACSPIDWHFNLV